jgi:outer membrane protein assembly factor BamA
MSRMIRHQLRNRLLCILAVLLFFSPCIRAQSSTKYNLLAIHFAGLSRYTSEQAIAGSGLHLGQSVTTGDLQSAAEHLSQSGAFDTVSFQYSMRGNDLTAQFGIKETKDVLPCIFDNFVWFSDADLDRLLRQQVTFYTGDSPVRGDSVGQIRSVLQDFLRANGISGEVGEIPYAGTGGARALLFHIDGVSQPIKKITFSGEAALTAEQLSDASAELADQDFSAVNIATYASAALLPLYYRRGYLRSQFDRPKVSLIDPNSKGPVTKVSIILPVVEGNQYSWNGATWSGNQVLSTDELVKALGMNPQEIANKEKIDTGFAIARQLYLSRGYIDIRIQPVMALDDTTKLASYSVQITEGSQFHMGQVFFDGLPEIVAAALSKKWKLKPGDVYDATYAADFVKNTAGKVLSQQGVTVHTFATREEADKDKLIVNLHLLFH